MRDRVGRRHVPRGRRIRRGRLDAIPRADGARGFRFDRAAAHLERDGKHRLEDADSRQGLVVAGRARQSDLDDHGARRRAFAAGGRASIARRAAILHDVEVFHVENPDPCESKNSHASPTPVIEPGRLYVHFGTMGTACISTETGKTIWTNNDLKLDHSQGPGSSLIVYRNLLIVTCDGMDVQYVIALDKYTGKKIWKTDRSGKTHDSPDRRKAFATPSVFSIGGRDELISPAANQVIAYDPLTGSELWKVRYDGYSNVPRPVFGDGLLFIGTGFDKAQLWAIRPGEHGDVTGTQRRLEIHPRGAARSLADFRRP